MRLRLVVHLKEKFHRNTRLFFLKIVETMTKFVKNKKNKSNFELNVHLLVHGIINAP